MQFRIISVDIAAKIQQPRMSHKYWPTNTIYFLWLFKIQYMYEKVHHVNLSHHPTHSINAVPHASPHWDWWLLFPVRLFIVLPLYVLISINLISLWIESDFNVNLCVSFNPWIQTSLQCQGWMGCCWDLFQLKGRGPSHAVSSEFHQASPKGSCYCLSPVSIPKLLSEEASPVTNINV